MSNEIKLAKKLAIEVAHLHAQANDTKFDKKLVDSLAARFMAGEITINDLREAIEVFKTQTSN